MDHEKFLGSTREEIAGHKAQGESFPAFCHRWSCETSPRSGRYFPNESSRFCGYVGDVTKCAGLSGTGMLSGGYLCGDERFVLSSKVKKVIDDCAQAVSSLCGCPDCN